MVIKDKQINVSMSKKEFERVKEASVNTKRSCSNFGRLAMLKMAEEKKDGDK